MEKMKYEAPEMEAVELKNKVALLAGSGDEASGEGEGF